MQHVSASDSAAQVAAPISTPIIYLFAIYVAFSQFEATVWMVSLVAIFTALILWWSWNNEKKDMEMRKKQGQDPSQQYQEYYKIYEQFKQREAAAAAANITATATA